jgi:hypothetical protein
MTVAPEAGRRTSGRAIAALVRGIAGLATAGIVLGWIAVAIIAVVLLAILGLVAL